MTTPSGIMKTTRPPPIFARREDRKRNPAAKLTALECSDSPFRRSGGSASGGVVRAVSRGGIVGLLPTMTCLLGRIGGYPWWRSRFKAHAYGFGGRRADSSSLG